MSARARWGVAAASLYVLTGVVLVRAGSPVLPLFDGLAPPAPYRWVEPPPELAEGNEEPLDANQEIPLGEGLGALSAVTGDGQAQITVIEDAVDAPPDAEAAVLTIEPLDPASLGPPPEGFRFDSNAYRYEAVTVPGDEPLVLTGEATIILTYATRAGRLLRWTGSGWERLDTTVLGGTLQVLANTSELGTFVAAGREQQHGGVAWPLWAGIGGGALAAIGGLELWLRRRRRQRALERARGAKAKSKKRERRSE
jgi:hypothetical protein